MTRGRPFQVANKFGRGRPKGSRNKRSQLAQDLFDQHSPAIMALAISRCKDDGQMLRLLASRIAPRVRDRPVRLGPLRIGTAAELDQTSETVLRQATAGKIGVSEAVDLFSMIETRRRVLVALDLERRLSALEKA